MFAPRLVAAAAALFPALAFADAPSLGSKEGFTPLIPLALIFMVFYFMVIRPQQKRAKLHQQFLVELKRGDLVVTASGIIGTIKLLSEKFVTLEVDDNVCLKMLRTQVLEGASSLKDKEEKANA